MHKRPVDVKEGKERSLIPIYLVIKSFSYTFVSPFLPENLIYVNSLKFQLIKISNMRYSMLFERTFALLLPGGLFSDDCF